MKKGTPRLPIYIYFWLLLTLWQGPPTISLILGAPKNITYAESLTAPTIGEASATIVTPSKISLEQWQALQTQASQNLLSDKVVVEFLDTHFKVDGTYGETLTGEIVSDWEALAKPMGTSGLALAGAYAVWRRRRLTTLQNLRAGDGATLEQLFAQHFDTTESQSKAAKSLEKNHPTPLSSTPPPHNSASWKAWGESQGLLASGATLGALFALWQQRRQPKSPPSKWHDFFQSAFEKEPQAHFQTFQRAVQAQAHTQTELAVNQALAHFQVDNPEPLAPPKNERVEAYEHMTSYNYMRGFMPYAQAVQNANAIRHNHQAKVTEIKKGLIAIWKQHAYFESVGNNRGAEAMNRLAYKLTTFGERFASARERWEISHLKAQAKQSFTSLEREYENHKLHHEAYAALKSAYESKKRSVIKKAEAPFKDWHTDLWRWWQQTTQKLHQSQQWVSGLNLLRTQNTAAFKAKSEQTKADKVHLIKRLAQSVNAETVQTRLKTQPVGSQSSEPIGLSPAEFTQALEQKRGALLEEQNSRAVTQHYEDQAAQALGYKVITGRNGKRYYYQPYFNARFNRWEDRSVTLDHDTKAQARRHRESDYARKLEMAKQKLATQEALYLTNKLSLDNRDQNLSASYLGQFKNFLKWVQTNADQSLAENVWRQWNQLHKWQKSQSEKKLAVLNKKLSWPDRFKLEQDIKTLENQINQSASELETFISTLRADSEPSGNSVINEADLNFYQQELEHNDVYQYLQNLNRERLFYQRYGQDISVLENLKAQVKAQLEAQAHLEHKTAYTHGYEFYDYEALKKDYELLLNDQLPPVYVPNWNWFKSNYRTKRTTAVPNRNDGPLHEWHHLSQTLFNAEQKVEYKRLYEEREADLMKQRGEAFDARTHSTLNQHFSESEIKTYQYLVSKVTSKENQIQNLKLGQAQVETERIKTVQASNLNQTSSRRTPRAQAIASLKLSDITAISVQADNDSSVTNSHRSDDFPPQLQEPLWQAYRRFNQAWEFEPFQAEAKRLVSQAQAQYRTGLIADSGLDPEPVQTKTVRDYLEDPNAFNQEIDQQMADVRAGIPKLKTIYAGQNYLQTALTQAEKKIEALEKYRRSGPKEVEAYKAQLQAWQTKHKTILAQIELGVTNHFSGLENYLNAFWHKASSVAEEKAKAIESENIIDTRQTVEKVESNPWLISSEDPSVKEQLNEFIKTLGSRFKAVASNSLFSLGNSAEQSQQKLYQTFQEKQLRKQGLTSSPRNNETISKLHPLIQADTINFMNEVEDTLNLKLTISDGLRTIAEQDQLYAQGRENDKPIVTNAKGGESYHNYGLAIDVVEIKNHTINYDLEWGKIAEIGNKYGFEWGGTWKNFPDKPHFQKTFGFSIKELQEKSSGNGFVNLGEENTTATFPEDYYQAWAKHQPYAHDESYLREQFIKDQYSLTKNVPLTTFEVFSRNLSLVSNGAQTEIKRVHADIINFLKDGHKLEAELAAKYIERIRKADHGHFDHENAAYFAADAYTNQSDQLLGFKRISNKYGISDTDLVNTESGFSATLYENDDTLLIAFAGTNELKDWKRNIDNALGKVTDQYTLALKLVEKLSFNSSKKIVLVGHSLGGGLAAAAGAKFGFETITFNSAGNNPKVLKENGVVFTKMEAINAYTNFMLPDAIAKKFEKEFPNITNHVTRGDILTEAQELMPILPVAIGKQVKHDSIMNNWIGIALKSRNPKAILLATIAGTLQHKKY